MICTLCFFVYKNFQCTHYIVLIAMATEMIGKGYLVFALTFQMNDGKHSSKFAHHPILGKEK